MSVARTARDYGLNANQLHNWIGLYRKEGGVLLAGAGPIAQREIGSAFIPVVAAKLEEMPHNLKLDVTLANGIRADLTRLSLNDVLAILPVLSALPCSASTRG
jgi:transposase-like protein